MRIANVAMLSDWQRCRELNLFCQSCHEHWEEAVPRTFPVRRLPCPHCKADSGVIAVNHRRENL